VGTHTPAPSEKAAFRPTNARGTARHRAEYTALSGCCIGPTGSNGPTLGPRQSGPMTCGPMPRAIRSTTTTSNGPTPTATRYCAGPIPYMIWCFSRIGTGPTRQRAKDRRSLSTNTDGQAIQQRGASHFGAIICTPSPKQSRIKHG
jgi:hypothetical protein